MAARVLKAALYTVWINVRAPNLDVWVCVRGERSDEKFIFSASAAFNILYIFLATTYRTHRAFTFFCVIVGNPIIAQTLPIHLYHVLPPRYVCKPKHDALGSDQNH
ncbi:hypothetical protein [Burkholderia ambifaria]|uniref:hypothetical protein n=1 Tax=Burkholderia ambifaria TaxID=152480 RepID=UPI00158F2EEE|nr:hypothetical protein [Burkholderia ambifaria]